MADISLSDVRKVYPGAQEPTIPGLSIDIVSGELCVLVGPSGCGKSTLLRMVAGLEEVSGGDVTIAGRRVNDLEPAERDIAMVFQNYALYPHMTIYNNMAYGLKNRGMARDEIRRRVDEAAVMLGLDGFLARRPRELSGGQRQRVAMGRAIVREPKAFLFDEPLSNLDAKLRVKTRVEIRDLQRRLRTTSIYVTHDQQEAMTLADKLVVMNDGRIEQTGTPMEVYERPASLFVAGFIGSPPMNLLPRSAVPSLVPASAPEHALIGVRPEALMPAEDGPLVLEVRVVERLGASSNIHGRLPGLDTDVIASVPNTVPAEPGRTMCFSSPPDAVHLFDGTTGRRLG